MAETHTHMQLFCSQYIGWSLLASTPQSKNVSWHCRCFQECFVKETCHIVLTVSQLSHSWLTTVWSSVMAGGASSTAAGVLFNCDHHLLVSLCSKAIV